MPQAMWNTGLSTSHMLCIYCHLPAPPKMVPGILLFLLGWNMTSQCQAKDRILGLGSPFRQGQKH